MVGNKTVLKKNLNKIEDLEKKNRQQKQEITLKNLIFDISPNYIIILGLNGKIIEVNQSVKDLLHPENKALPKKLSQLDIIHIKDLHKFIKSTNSILNGNTIKPFKAIFLTPEKEFIHVNVQIFPVEYDGEIIAISIYATDIADQVLLEESHQENLSLHKDLEDKKMLLREIHHRTKNNLMIMASLLSLTSADIEDKYVQQIFKQAQSRVKSMALIHEKLYRSDDFKEINFADYIHHLAKDLFNSILRDPDQIQLIMELEDLKLDINTGIPLGLILNELLTNSIKYAFPNEEYGSIFIGFYKTTDYYAMIVSDNGMGLSPDLDITKTDTLGFQLVNNLVEQIKGKVTLNRKGGTEVIVRFTLDNKN